MIAVLAKDGKIWKTKGPCKLDWLEEFLALPNGIPCPDTFRRVFERINPKVFERCFHKWVQSIIETLGAQVIPIDGKDIIAPKKDKFGLYQFLNYLCCINKLIGSV